MSGVTTRLATADDIPAIVAQFAAVAAEGKWIRTQAPVDVAERERRFAASLESGASIMLIAEERGALVGQLSLWLRDGRAHLGMMVAATERGRGIGRALMEQAFGEARAREILSIDLEVYGHNGAARALYRSLGFVESAPAGSEERATGERFEVIPMTLALHV